MIQKINAKVPQIRLKGFDKEWNVDFLGNKVDFFSGLTYSPSNIQKGAGTLVIRSSNVKNGEIVEADNVYVDSNVVNSKNVEVGDIAIVVRNGSRSLIGKHAQVKKRMENTVIGAFMTGISSQTPSFTNALLDTKQFSREVAKNLGATINQITIGGFREMSFSFPELEEQIQIGNYFNELDHLIQLHQLKHEKLVTLKKAMLQKMFPQTGATKPEIRFKGFDGDWAEIALGEVLIAHPFKPYVADPFSSGPFEVLQQGDNPVSGYSSGSPFQEYENVILFGDHTMSLYAPTNPFFVASDGIKILGNRIGLFRDYLYSLLVAYMPPSEGYKRHLSILKAVHLPISLDQNEQQKIGNYFRKLDGLIALHATQMEKLKQIKSACLEKMFV